MPIYEYDCPNCQKILEVMQKFSDAPLSECPDCGKSGITKRMSLSSFSLKGTGWYSTDYKKSSAPSGGNPAPSGGSTGGSTGGTSGGSTGGTSGGSSGGTSGGTSSS